MCDALHYFWDNILIRFCSKLYRQIVVFQWLLIVLHFLQICFCFVMRDFMLSLSNNNHTDIIEAFNSTSRNLDDLLNIDNSYFEHPSRHVEIRLIG